MIRALKMENVMDVMDKKRKNLERAYSVISTIQVRPLYRYR